MAKIIVTVGPKSISSDVLNKLTLSGADKFRINLSHSDKENLSKYFIKLCSKGINPSIDTQGAQLRVNFTSIFSKPKVGDLIYIVFDKGEKLSKKNIHVISLNHPESYEQIQIKDILKVDFEGLAVEIIEKDDGTKIITSRVKASGNVLLNRAIDIQNKSIQLDTLTEFDKYAIDYSLSHGSKEIYASFISSADEVSLIKEKIDNSVKVISKIETAKGLANVREIIEASDEILIDRGDLSREISIPAVPIAVFNVIKIAKEMDTPVNIATNVLDSMMTKNIPSRAEISDIFSNLSAGASGIVLAAEVAIGSNPVKSTALLKYIMNLFDNFQNGLHGLGSVEKPDIELIGEELYNWL